MINYVSFLLEARAAKRRLAQLFESETPGRTEHLSTTMVAPESSHAACGCTKPNKQMCQNWPGANEHVPDRTRTALPTKQPGKMKRDNYGQLF
jgi:hypothetical protein